LTELEAKVAELAAIEDRQANVAAFAALDAIRAGLWDRHLVQLAAAIRHRRLTPAYLQTVSGPAPQAGRDGAAS
jgi:hypothetical protein